MARGNNPNIARDIEHEVSVHQPENQRRVVAPGTGQAIDGGDEALADAGDDQGDKKPSSRMSRSGPSTSAIRPVS